MPKALMIDPQEVRSSHTLNFEPIALNHYDQTVVDELSAGNVSKEDLRAIQRLVACGVDLEGTDYDHRTALHLAASEGHERLVQYFSDQAVELAPLDRWGGTPLDDAQRHGHERVAQLLEKLSKARG